MSQKTLFVITSPSLTTAGLPHFSIRPQAMPAAVRTSGGV